MRYFGFYFFVMFLTFGIKAEVEPDSLIKFNELNFKNDLERDAFYSFMINGSKADVIDLFLTSFENSEPYDTKKVHETILNFVNELKNSTDDLADAKKVKFIYKEVHRRFFKLYKLNNSFADVFKKGEYNCVSGSIMYAIVFHYMNIPYKIVEAPQHVFIVAYPESHKILIETTSPKNGYFTFTNEYMERFIKHLYESKLITQQEFENNSSRTLFDKYYFADNGLNIYELAGIQYCNYAAYHIDETSYDKAISEIKKAYFLFKSERHKYLLKNISLYLVSTNDYRKLDDVDHLLMLCRLNNVNKKEVSDETIKYEFGRIVQSQLINNSNYSLFDSSYKLVNSVLKDSIIRAEIDFYYHYELARLGLMNRKPMDYELNHLKGAYKVKPKHADLQNLVKGYFSILLEKSNDVNEIMKSISSFKEHFDFLNSDVSFNSVNANCLLELCYQHAVLQEITKSEMYRKEFEGLCEKNTQISASENFIEKAYATLASYYFKKGNRAKAKDVLVKGLTYAPTNFGLKMRLNQLN